MRAPGEFEIIERWFTRPSRDADVRVGIGDDAAIVATSGPLAIAVDMLVAGTHFPEGFAADAIGHRALAVNLSDLAAMGAVPRWATLAISLPSADAAWLEGFAKGFFALAGRFGVSLIGGDTTRGPLTVTVGIFGDAAAEPLLRSGGRPGDRVYVSGTLGDSAAGLAVMTAQDSVPQSADRELLARFLWPEPRVALGRRLVGLARSAIDVSDGLAADLGHICERSGTGAVIDLDALPRSAALRERFGADRAEAFALSGGDDYELCFTVAPDDRERVAALAADLGVALTEIGELTLDPGVRGRRGGREQALVQRGFAHF